MSVLRLLTRHVLPRRGVDAHRRCRYDGIRYGLRADADSLKSMYMHTRGQGLGAEVKRRILMGTYALSAGYYDAFYKKAQQVRCPGTPLATVERTANMMTSD